MRSLHKLDGAKKIVIQAKPGCSPISGLQDSNVIKVDKQKTRKLKITPILTQDFDDELAGCDPLSTDTNERPRKFRESIIESDSGSLELLTKSSKAAEVELENIAVTQKNPKLKVMQKSRSFCETQDVKLPGQNDLSLDDSDQELRIPLTTPKMVKKMNSSVNTTKRLKLVRPLTGKMLSPKLQRGKLFRSELRTTSNQSSQALSLLAQPLMNTDTALSPRSKPKGSETTDLLKLTRNSETTFLKKLHLESVQTPKK